MIEESWEYRYETMGGFFGSWDVERRLLDLLNRLGREGWELASHDRSWTHRYRLYLKRRLPPSAARSANANP